MRKCGVTKNVFGYSCRYTVYHTQNHTQNSNQNNNHLDQNIGIIWHKGSMLVNDNTAEYKSFLKKRNYHETIYDGAISMTNRLVGFLKQAKNRLSD